MNGVYASYRHRNTKTPKVIRFTCPDGTRTEILRERIARPPFSHSHHHPEKPVRNCIGGKHKKWRLIRWWRAAWSTGGVKLHSFKLWGTERAESKEHVLALVSTCLIGPHQPRRRKISGAHDMTRNALLIKTFKLNGGAL